MSIEITTNNVPRSLLDGYELTEDERKEYDHLTEEELFGGDFVRYKGVLYHMSEFTTTAGLDLMDKWDGYINWTYFSGILIKRDPFDQDKVIIGRYFIP